MKLASSLAACVTLAVLVTVMAQERPQPVLLGSFETAEESKPFAAVGGCKAERVQEHAAQGQWALKVLFPGSPKDTWPGLAYKPVGDLSKYELLAFDVFNPSDEKVSLSIRIDPAEGEAVFAGYSLKPKGMTTCEVYLKGYADATGAVRLKQILPYRRMPREDATLYFDNFRLGFAMDKFKETVYADDSPMPDLTAADRERGFVLFARPYLDAVFPNTIPKPEELNPKLDLFAARGEREPVTFSVRALRDLKGLTATVSPLDDGAGHGIPASRVEVRLVRNLRKRFHYAALEYILMPTYLELAKPLDLPANTAQRFWLTVHVPEDAAPAIYHGRVTLRAEGAEASIPLRLRVLPFKLDDPPGIAYGPYYRPYQLAKQGDLAAQRDFIRRDLQDMRDHGMTSLGLCVGLDSAKVKMDGDKVDLGLDGASPFEMALDAYRDLRFPEPVCLLTDGAQSFAGKHKLETDEFAAAYKAVTMALNAEAKRRGWPEIILQPVDEPGWQDQAARDRNVRCLQILKQIPGQRTEQDGPGDKYFHEVAGPLADVWNYNGSYASPEVIKKAKAAGKLIWIYNNDVEGYRPEMMRYTAGFHLAATGSDGVFNWEYRGGTGDLYNDFDGTHGDFVFNYLPSKDSTGGPATGWEGFREGIDDQRHIALLRKTIARCRAANKPGAERAEAVLDRVLKSLDYKPGLRGAVKFDRVTVSPEGQKQFRGQFKLPNGWDFSMYDKARWQVAQATLELMQSLGELPAPSTAQKQDATSQLAIRAVQFVKDEPVTSAGKPRVEAGRPKLTIPEAKSPPIIDGKTTDAAWRRAPEIARMALHEGEGPPTQQTQVWLAFDATHLYLAAWCGEAKIRDLVTNVKSDFGPVWNDDCLELFVDANQDRATYFHVAVNPLGVKWLNLEAEAARNSKVRTAATIAEHGWYCEMAIPLAELGERHAEWGLNVCRERRAGGGLELSCWSPTYGGFGSPERFGDATLGEKFIRAVVLGNVFIGRNVAKVALQNEDPTGVEFALSGRIEPQGGQPPPAVPTVHLSLGPGERKEVDLPFDVSLGAGEQALLVELRRQPDGSLITSRRATFAVPQPMRLSVSPKLLYAQESALVAHLSLAMADEALRTAALTLELTPLLTARVTGLRSRHLRLVAHVPRLPSGKHTLTVKLLDAAGARLCDPASADFEVIPGPFEP